jgi:hypothetical protein
MNNRQEELLKYYTDNQDEIEKEFSQYLSENDWGSGEDKIIISDKLFFSWLETYVYNKENNKCNLN